MTNKYNQSCIYLKTSYKMIMCLWMNVLQLTFDFGLLYYCNILIILRCILQITENHSYVSDSVNSIDVSTFCTKIIYIIVSLIIRVMVFENLYVKKIVIKRIGMVTITWMLSIFIFDWWTINWISFRISNNCTCKRWH